MIGAANESSNPVDDLQSPQELLDGLREQYLQALYISKVGTKSFFVLGLWTLLNSWLKDISGLFC